MTIETVINQQIANWNVVYTKLHHFHWFVKGSHFFTLHAKFEELYEEAATVIDEMAERLLMSGGIPIASLKQYLELSTIDEATEMVSAEEMVKTLVKDFSLIIDELKAGIEVADQNNDEVTADLFLGLIEKLDKHNWMLNSFLGK